ncbi:RHS repeat-associated core domain-containing protein [Pseudomonas putida]|uniref:RHS repeat-associated core domain-containing protein n=1 Tax=Pseudomonas putida TaxID=303 RepID=UPI0009BCFE63|nr:RHS repeat-associated core domain-containing protein [Pseudomonas putida]
MNKYGTHVYSPYGFTASVHSAQTLLGFNGEYAQALTSLYMLGSGHRGYNTDMMRFISPDRLSPFGDGGLNTYAYCAGDPVNRTDPTGRSFLHNVYKQKRIHQPRIQIPKRDPELTLPTPPPHLAKNHFSKTRLGEMTYAENQYLFRVSKAELSEAKRAIFSSNNEDNAAASKRFISLENRHHELAEGLNTKITDRYSQVIQAMTEQNLYRPKLKLQLNPELINLIRHGMDVAIPNAYDMRTVNPPY